MRRGLVIEGGWGLGAEMSGCVQEEGQLMGGEVSGVSSIWDLEQRALLRRGRALGPSCTLSPWATVYSSLV